MKKTDTIYMRNPAMWMLNDASDATPLGNGRTGVLVKGGIGHEEIIFNRYDLWHWEIATELPRISDALAEARELIEQKQYLAGNNLMYDRLCEAGYVSEPGGPLPLGSLKMCFGSDAMFTGYRRILRMDQGECEITYTQKERHVSRKCFVSRKDDTFYYEYQTDKDTDVEISFGFFDDGTADTERTKQDFINGLTLQAQEDGFVYKVKTKEKEFGAAVRIFGARTQVKDGKICLAGSSFRIAVKCYSGKRSLSRFRMPEDFDYGEKLKKHAALHKRLYHSAELNIASTGNRSNEELLAEAYESKGSLELLEKMWKFGRYLFISGTCKEGLPFALYGLWHPKNNLGAAQNVANENVQCIYWHINTGGLADLMKPVIDYYYAHMEDFREIADKVYGCKGIFVGTYTSPVSCRLNLFVPVILHFTSVAGWLSQHFYQYYRMTGDEKLLREKILPFMLEAADFYLDFMTYDENGRVQLCPSVSPENSPSNVIIGEDIEMGHPNPAVKNATMEIAIVKELFTNILTLIRETGDHLEYREPLQKALDKMPPYSINQDGAVKEWLDEGLEDNYHHRHLSHIYPVFPGEEISEESDPELYKAFVRAVDLRELTAQSGWSLTHTAAIYTTMKRPELAMECLDTLFKGCTFPNLFTIHNDYRDMGITLLWDRLFVQLDANMGLVHTVQKMLFDERRGWVEFLPALPERLNKGSVKGFCFTAGKTRFSWNKEKKQFKAVMNITRAAEIQIKLPAYCEDFRIETEGAEYTLSGRELVLKAQKGAVIKIFGI